LEDDKKHLLLEDENPIDPLNSKFLVGVFDNDVLLKNIRKMDSLYQNCLNEDADKIDERFFINQNEKLKTPIKMLQ